MIVQGQMCAITTDNRSKNLYNVLIPLFGENTILQATAVVQPGSIPYYQEGDLVFVAFCENSLNLPIIIGQLYVPSRGKNIEDEADNSSLMGGWLGAKKIECKDLIINEKSITEIISEQLLSILSNSLASFLPTINGGQS